MKLESKFDLNQKVFRIGFNRKSEQIACEACGGSGRVVLADHVSRICPECYGKATKTILHDEKWRLMEELTIGQIRIQVSSIKSDGVFDNVGQYDESNIEFERRYMAYESGIGTGTIWKEDDLFDSRIEADSECERRNNDIPGFEGTREALQDLGV